MMYCSRCGAEVREDAGYCYKCGSPIYLGTTNAASSSGPAMSSGNTGLELLSTQKDLQDLWLRRAIAFLVDAVIVSLFALAIGLALAIPTLLFTGNPFTPFLGFWFGGLVSLLLVVYFVLAEAGWKRTVGKEVLGLRSVRLDGKPLDLKTSLVRNISKINWLLLLVDITAGLALKGDARQKFSDRYAGTMVESTRVSSKILG